MALEAADDDLDVEIFDELDSYSKIFEELSLQLLEFSYQSDDDLTQHLLTASLDNWSRQTCLSLAVVANNLRLGFFFFVISSIFYHFFKTNIFPGTM